MIKTISITHDDVSSQERVSDFLSVASAMISGIVLLLAVAISF